ncbi:MAG: (5-formylfuran-3-yl)methyl phosphate synthase [Gemmatimonadaceae bacterium]
MSVRNADEARDALDGGADVIDAKDPSLGPLGAVDGLTLARVVSVTGRERPVSAALGDVCSEHEAERLAHQAAAHGVSFIKIGFAGVSDSHRAGTLLAAAVRGAGGAHGNCGVVAVAYADADRAKAISPAAVIRIAHDAGARGVLLDTAHKEGRTVFAIMGDRRLGQWVAEAHRQQLMVALAGQLSARDFSRARSLTANMVGVRGAACVGSRTGTVSRSRVAILAAAARDHQLFASAADRVSGSMIETRN